MLTECGCVPPSVSFPKLLLGVVSEDSGKFLLQRGQGLTLQRPPQGDRGAPSVQPHGFLCPTLSLELMSSVLSQLWVGLKANL